MVDSLKRSTLGLKLDVYTNNRTTADETCVSTMVKYAEGKKAVKVTVGELIGKALESCFYRSLIS